MLGQVGDTIEVEATVSVPKATAAAGGVGEACKYSYQGEVLS